MARWVYKRQVSSLLTVVAIVMYKLHLSDRPICNSADPLTICHTAAPLDGGADRTRAEKILPEDPGTPADHRSHVTSRQIKNATTWQLPCQNGTACSRLRGFTLAPCSNCWPVLAFATPPSRRSPSPCLDTSAGAVLERRVWRRAPLRPPGPGAGVGVLLAVPAQYCYGRATVLGNVRMGRT